MCIANINLKNQKTGAHTNTEESKNKSSLKDVDGKSKWKFNLVQSLDTTWKKNSREERGVLENYTFPSFSGRRIVSQESGQNKCNEEMLLFCE